MDIKQVVQNISDECKKQGIKKKDLLEDCGLNQSYFSHIVNRNQMPTLDTIARIADKLDCSIDYLIGREKSSETTIDSEAFENNIKNLSDEDAMLLRSVYQRLLRQNNQAD